VNRRGLIVKVRTRKITVMRSPCVTIRDHKWVLLKSNISGTLHQLSPDVTCCRGWPAVTPYHTYKLPAGSESVGVVHQDIVLLPKRRNKKGFVDLSVWLSDVAPKGSVWPAAACMLVTSVNPHSLSILSSAPCLIRFCSVPTRL
jgi:hypothetical protein